jgi:hypothetical protein
MGDRADAWSPFSREKRRRIMRAVFALALGLGVSACAPGMETAPPLQTTAPACQSGSNLMNRVELIFGARWKGGPITPNMWKRFLAEEVTPRFPDGLSTFDIKGQWRNAKGQIVKLPSRILLIWYSPAPDASAKIDAIRDAFNKRFDQESVMRIDGVNCVGF